MIVLEVSVNGEEICRAGAPDLSVLSAIVLAVGKLGDLSRGAVGRESTIDLEIRVGGLTAKTKGLDEHLDWAQRDLQAGNIVTIRLLDRTDPQPPTSSRPANPEDDEERKFLWAKDAYLKLRGKYEGAG